MVKEDLIQEIKKKRANISVIGLGYVGLPLAVTFANAGFNVTGIDPVEEKVDMINRGESYISDITNAQLRKHIDSGRLRATTDYSVLAEIDAVSRRRANTGKAPQRKRDCLPARDASADAGTLCKEDGQP